MKKINTNSSNKKNFIRQLYKIEKGKQIYTTPVETFPKNKFSNNNLKSSNKLYQSDNNINNIKNVIDEIDKSQLNEDEQISAYLMVFFMILCIIHNF